LASRRLGTLDVSANEFTKEGRLLNVNGSGGDGGDVSDEGWQRKRKVQVARLGEGRTRDLRRERKSFTTHTLS
jgi:hypothetical protein